ncbi:ParB N-terminal domain-containing protein, partial [Leptospira stimsonii]
MQKYSPEIEISISELEPYRLPIKRKRKISQDKVGTLPDDILKNGLLNAIVISSKRNDRGKYVIYAGDRRTSA